MFHLDPETWAPRRDHYGEFGKLVEDVNAVNHGEFETAVSAILEEAKVSDVGGKPATLAIQRCRRGGKTFMLHALAARLQTKVDNETFVIFVSLNNATPYAEFEQEADEVIFRRIAYEFSGAEVEIEFEDFMKMYDNFTEVRSWMKNKKIILLVDELNVIEPESDGYDLMSNALHKLVGREGCAIVYSTHHRDTKDFLRGRTQGRNLSVRRHDFLMIPRIERLECLRGMYQKASNQPSFWTAVLRGRLPALMNQRQAEIVYYSEDMFSESRANADRIAALSAVITGDIAKLPSGRELFKSYSYMCERFQKGGRPRFAWPPFLIAQESVIGKDCSSLRESLEAPSIDEAKAFEALTQLAVFVRLLSEEHHYLVPHNPNISEGGAYVATEVFHLQEEAETIDQVKKAVKAEFSDNPDVMQVVAVPYFASFPTYDFFIFHREAENRWSVAAGYQCKLGHEHPCEEASNDIPLSVWLEGKCRKYRIVTGKRAQRVEKNGWQLMGASGQASMLGVSIAEALPMDVPALEVNKICSAEMVYQSKLEAAEAPSVASSSSSGKDDDDDDDDDNNNNNGDDPDHDRKRPATSGDLESGGKKRKT